MIEADKPSIDPRVGFAAKLSVDRVTPPQQITVSHARDPVHAPREFHEIVSGDNHELRVALRREQLTLNCSGKKLHKGWALPGMMRLLSPGEEVRGVLYTPSDTVAFQIPGPHLLSIMQAVSPHHRKGAVCFVDALLQPSAHVEQIGRAALQAQHFDPLHAQLFLDGLVHSLLACLLHHHRLEKREDSGEKKFTPTELKQVIDFAEAHFEHPLSLEAWARELKMQQAEFRRRFRLSVGSAPYSWFLNRRIERAKELLRRNTLPLCQIALSVGFSSQSHFTEAFRRRTCTSPARWQQGQGG